MQKHAKFLSFFLLAGIALVGSIFFFVGLNQKIASKFGNLAAVAGVPQSSCTASRTFYIDYVGGNDSNTNATQKSTPWKFAPGMKDFAGSYSHQEGDCFIFKGGVTWKNETKRAFPMVVSYSGNSTKDDYYGIDKTWYSGPYWSRPVFDLQGVLLPEVSGFPAGGGRAVVDASYRKYVTVEGVEIKNQVIPPDYDLCDTYDPGQMAGGIVAYSAGYITVRNVYIHDWIFPADRKKDTNNAGGVIMWQMTGPSTLEYSEIGPGGPTLGVYPTGHPKAGQSRGSKNNGAATRNIGLVRYNILHDTPNTYNGGGEVYGNHIYNVNDSFDDMTTYECGSSNPMYDQHENAIQTFVPSKIHNNLIHDATGAALLPGPAFSCSKWDPVQNKCVEQGGMDYIYNNIIFNPIGIPPAGVDCRNTVIGGVETGAYIYNNIFEGFVRTVGANCSKIDFRNNLVIGSVDFSSVPQSGVINQNNVVTSASALASVGVTEANLYRLTPQATNLLDKGQSLSSVFNKGIVYAVNSGPGAEITLSGEVARPQDAGWDIGAYEYSDTFTPPTTSTTTLTINLTKSGTGSGIVSASAGTSCGSNCYQITGTGAQALILTATPSNSTISWNGCSSSSGNICTVSSGSTATVSVTATFTAIAPPPTISNGTTLPITLNTPLSFNISASGDYKLTGLGVSTLDAGSNSFYASIDTPPGTANAYVWDLNYPLSNATVEVSNRGSNACDSGLPTCAQFNPKTWTLSPGTHTLYINSRETNTNVTQIRFNTVSTTPPPTNYTLTISKNIGNAGTITSALNSINCGGTCTTTAPQGTSVTLTATANSGYSFVNWNNCTPVPGHPTQCTLTLNSNTTVSAIFGATAPVSFTVSANKTPTNSDGYFVCTVKGTTTSNSCPVTAQTGQTVRVNAQSGSNYRFEKWTSGPCANSTTYYCDTTTTSSMTANYVLKAPPSYSLRSETILSPRNIISEYGVGSGSVFISPVSCTGQNCFNNQSIPAGSTIKITASPASDTVSAFGGWQVTPSSAITSGCTDSLLTKIGQQSTCTVTINANTEVYAYFYRPKKTTTPAPTSITVPVTVNTPVTFTIPQGAGGEYKLKGKVKAPRDDANSFFINIDSSPVTDESMIWDIDVNASFTTPYVSWRGNGNGRSDCATDNGFPRCAQYNPKTWNLTAGDHKIYVNQRESLDTVIESIEVVRVGTQSLNYNTGISSEANVFRVIWDWIKSWFK